MANSNFTEDEAYLPPFEERYRWQAPALPSVDDVMPRRVSRIRDFLDGAGLGWVHKNTDYTIDRRLAGGAHVKIDPAGRFEIGFSPQFLLEDRDHIDHAMFHEHAHIIDWMGLLYSQTPEWKVRFNALGRSVPIGSVAKELFALHKSDGIFKQLLNYPLADERYLGDRASAQILQAEIFAQVVAAYSFENSREVLQNEAPETAQFIADSVRHAAEHGEVPRFADAIRHADQHGESIQLGAHGRSALKSIVDSFNASRSSRGVSDSEIGKGDRARFDEAAQEALTAARSRNHQHPRSAQTQVGAIGI